MLDWSNQDGQVVAKKGWLKKNHFGTSNTQDVLMMRYWLICFLIFFTQSFVAGVLLIGYIE